jgi:transcription elongation factor Elf1
MIKCPQCNHRSNVTFVEDPDTDQALLSCGCCGHDWTAKLPPSYAESRRVNCLACNEVFTLRPWEWSIDTLLCDGCEDERECAR